MELDCSLVNVTTKEQVVNLLSNHKINLILIDCDTYRPINFNILEFIQNINKNTYCLIVETSIHEIDKDALLAQITKQCMLQEIYSYQLFVKHFYNNYLSETEKTILLKEDLSNNKKDTESYKELCALRGEEYESQVRIHNHLKIDVYAEDYEIDF